MELLFALSVCLENDCIPQSSASFLRQEPCLGSLHICFLYVYLVLIDLATLKFFGKALDSKNIPMSEKYHG